MDSGQKHANQIHNPLPTMVEWLQSWPFSIGDERHPSVAALVEPWMAAGIAIGTAADGPSSNEAIEDAKAIVLNARSIARDCGIAMPVSQISEPFNPDRAPRQEHALFKRLASLPPVDYEPPDRTSINALRLTTMAHMAFEAPRLVRDGVLKSLGIPRKSRFDGVSIVDGCETIRKTFGLRDISIAGERFLFGASAGDFLDDLFRCAKTAAKSLGIEDSQLGLSGSLSLRLTNPAMNPKAIGEFVNPEEGVAAGRIEIGFRKVNPSSLKNGDLASVIAHEWIHAADSLAFEALVARMPAQDSLPPNLRIDPAVHARMFSKQPEEIRERFWPEAQKAWKGAILACASGAVGDPGHLNKKAFNLISAKIPSPKRIATPGTLRTSRLVDALCSCREAYRSGLVEWPDEKSITNVTLTFPLATRDEARLALSSPSIAQTLDELSEIHVAGSGMAMRSPMLLASSNSDMPLYLKSPSEILARLFSPQSNPVLKMNGAIYAPEEFSPADHTREARACFRQFLEGCGIKTRDAKPGAFSRLVSKAAFKIAQRNAASISKSHRRSRLAVS